MTQNISKNLILVFIVIAALIGVGAVFYYQRGKGPGSQALSPQEVEERVLNYIRENVPETEASMVNIVEEGALYKLTLKLGEQEFVSYVTKDGKLLFPQAIDLEEASQEQEETSEQAPQSSVPDVKLFVMSYCPFGLQAEKALLPAWELLKDKASIGIYFVDYIMHGKEEIDENLRGYCIQQEEPEKFTAYLKCFAKDGDYQKCLDEIKIDQEKLVSCIGQADEAFKITEGYNDKSSWLNGKYPKFQVHAYWNNKYGVSGSPTFVINDAVVNVAKRSPEAFKAAICQAFDSAPEECSQQLSDEAASPGLGFGTGGGSGSCE